jgi:hypothetical protein
MALIGRRRFPKNLMSVACADRASVDRVDTSLLRQNGRHVNGNVLVSDGFCSDMTGARRS